jgi:hypothetical protein
MMYGERETTRGGNPRPPPVETYLQWIWDAWDSLPKELIEASFKTCGITNAIDGSEDDSIHCFKPNGPVPSGRLLLQRAREDIENEELAQLFEDMILSKMKKMVLSVMLLWNDSYYCVSSVNKVC